MTLIKDLISDALTVRGRARAVNTRGTWAHALRLGPWARPSLREGGGTCLGGALKVFFIVLLSDLS